MAEKTHRDSSTAWTKSTTELDRAARTAKIRETGREADRVYAMSVATVRKAAELTQDEVAERLGIGQGDVWKLERRDDPLLSTLLRYIELDLASLGTTSDNCAQDEPPLIGFSLATDRRVHLRSLGSYSAGAWLPEKR